MMQLGSPQRWARDQLSYSGPKLEIQVQFIEVCVGMETNEWSGTSSNKKNLTAIL